MTDDERVAQIEGQMDETMAGYDEMILREREYIGQRGNQQGSEQEVEEADSTGPLYDEGGESDGEGGGGGQQPGAPVPTGNSNTSGHGNLPDAPGDNRAGDHKHQGGVTPPPADIPSGDDDDVVARQIREAAMREQDPELREKLWQEYRKYKNQSKKD